MKENNIVLTGGHAGTTALSFVKEFKRSHPSYKIYWLGAKRAIEGSAVATIESKILPKEGVIFYPLFTGRLQRRFSIHTIPSILKIPVGIFQATTFLIKIRPRLILSFGGFAAFPVALAGSLIGIPVILHEQTAVVGRANKVSALFAKKIALARESSLSFFPKGKSVVIGNPLLPGLEAIKPKKEPGRPPSILITAGSRGSLTINRLVKGILDKLLTDFKVVHITGEIDFEKFRRKKNYLPLANVEPEEMVEKYKEADIVICRGGANTISEVVAAKRPALVIPLPFSYQDEQTKNALFAEEFGIAKVLPQESLNKDELLSKIYSTLREWKEIVSRVKDKKSPDAGANKRLVRLVEEYLK